MQTRISPVITLGGFSGSNAFVALILTASSKLHEPVFLNSFMLVHDAVEHATQVRNGVAPELENCAGSIYEGIT